MRTSMLPVMWLSLGLVGAAALGACKWTEFDDLSGDTWVVSTEKPSIKSNSYGIALQRGLRAPTTGAGGALVVIGADPPTYSQLVYSADGDAKLANAFDLDRELGIPMIDNQPIILADPSSDSTALVVNASGTQIVALVGSGTLDMHQLFVSPSSVDAGTYMQPPDRPDTHVAQPPRPLIASGEVVVGVTVNPQPPPANAHPTCKLVDVAAAITPRALGVARISSPMYDDVIAWGSGGKLYRYPPDVFNGCTLPKPAIASHDTGFMPGKGSQILSIDATHVLLQGHHDNDDKSLLQVFDANTLTPVGGSASMDKLRSAAILDVGTDQYVIAGYPADSIGGKPAGVVRLYRVSAAGIDPTPVTTLNDAQPEANKSFGRAVAAMPFNGKPVIAVAADNEIFVYFRANKTDGASLYDETRQGR